MAKSKKNQGKTVILTVCGLLLLSALVAVLLRGTDIILLNPKGLIAEEQYKLLLLSTAIMLGFGFVVLFFLYFFAWKYRETNEKSERSTRSKNSNSSAFAIWALPTGIAIILAVIMLPATQKLEPQKLISAQDETLMVQVVALRWKWLFIYPEQDIATVNYMQIPVDTPVQFELTADETPMSSFWIPHLGGMLYAMTEHVNRLNLIADTPGDYEGSAAEINGSGFAGMRFNTRVSTREEFNKWVNDTKLTSDELNESEYQKLLEPSKNNPAAFYAHPDPYLYSNILAKYGGAHSSAHGTYDHHGGHE